MPRGPTYSINKAKEAFEELKKESLIIGKNKAIRSQISKRSGTSRDNFYAKKTDAWKDLGDDIDNFAEEFEKLAKGKYKNPEVEVSKQNAKEWEEKYIAMAKQNYELLKQINDLNLTVQEKQQTINFLKNLS